MAVVAEHPLTNFQPFAFSLTAGSPAIADRVVRTLRLWRERIRERHAFVQFDEFALRDLGMSRWEIDRELAKPFWRG